MLVNLHFALSSLFAAVTCPHGPSGPNGRNPVLPALIGITDQHIVRITAAAHVLQYLLTCSPCQTPMDVDSDEGKEATRLKTYKFSSFFVSLFTDVVVFVVSRSGSGSEFSTGTGLQELWVKYRRLARYGNGTVC